MNRIAVLDYQKSFDLFWKIGLGWSLRFFRSIIANKSYHARKMGSFRPAYLGMKQAATGKHRQPAG